MVTSERSTKEINWDELIQPGRVSGRIYYDQEIYEEELQKIWYKDWVFVAHASEIKEPGDYVTRQIGLEPIIVSRGQDGRVHLMLNRCVHRGATVCQLESGNSSAFRCSYHGWTYRNSGELIGVPFDRAYPVSFKEEHPGLIEVARVDSYRGFIFGSMSEAGVSLDEFLGGAKDGLIDALSDLSPEGEIEIRSAWIKETTHCNWKAALDNPWGAGADHGDFTHRSQPKLLEGDTKSGARAGRDSVNPEGMARFIENGVKGSKDTSAERSSKKAYNISPVHHWPDGNGMSLPWVDVDNPHASERRYVKMMIERYGEERARELLTAGPPHGTMWPGVFFANQNFHVHVPTSPTITTSLYAFPFLKGAPDEFNDRHFRRFEGAFGPAGMVVSDDMEMWERIQRALAAGRGDEWIDMSKGTLENDEQVLFEQGGVVSFNESGHNEVGLRVLYRDYKNRMSQP